MLQYKIPQDVQIEDKILGPLTLKQLIIVAVGGGVSYTTFLIVSKSYLLGLFDYFWIAIPLLISVAFAFLKIQNVTFLKWLFLLYEFSHNSRRRHWDKSETARLHFTFVSAKITSTEKKKTTKNSPEKDIPGKKKFSSLEELTHVLDHHGQFAPQERIIADEHSDDHAIHLSEAEKTRHEQRILETANAGGAPAAA